MNFVYCHPVGHAVEALQHCLGYRRANPDRRIGLVLNADTATDLAAWCDAVDELYTVDIDVFTPPPPEALAHLPREWDWVVDDPRGHQEWQHRIFPGLAAYYQHAARHFQARHGHHVVGVGPSYRKRNPLRLRLPETARDWAATLLPESTEPTIAVLPAGSGERWQYPSLRSWQRILTACAERWPRARWVLTGKHASDGRTSTGFDRAEFQALAGVLDCPVWTVDLPLDRQLAALQRCDLLLAPHTGFAFAALAVGTPWLALAGNDWAEYYFNPGVPFYSVLPDVTRFPCYVLLGNQPDPVDDDGPRSPSMCAERIDADLDELLHGAAWLLSGTADFDTALRDHARRMDRLFGGRTALLYSIDDLLRDALSA